MPFEDSVPPLTADLVDVLAARQRRGIDVDEFLGHLDATLEAANIRAKRLWPEFLLGRERPHKSVATVADNALCIAIKSAVIGLGDLNIVIVVAREAISLVMDASFGILSAQPDHVAFGKLTEIELELAKALADCLLEPTLAALIAAKIVDDSARLQEPIVEENWSTPTNPATHASYPLTLASGDSAVPLMILVPRLPRQAADKCPTPPGALGHWRSALNQQISQIEIKLDAVLAICERDINEILTMSVGSTLDISAGVLDSFKLEGAGLPLFSFELTPLNGSIVVQISGAVDCTRAQRNN